MNTKEKTFLKYNMISALVLITIFVLLWTFSTKIMNNTFTDYLIPWNSIEQNTKLEPTDIRIEFDKKDIIKLESIEKEEGRIIYTLSPINSGKTFMSIYNTNTDETIYEEIYQVTPSGLIISVSTGNFTNYRIYNIITLLFCISFMVFLWISFICAQKILRYSSQSIFLSGLAIWMTLITILMTKALLSGENMLNVYEVFKTAATMFMFLSFPFILIFCIALSISNIKLIRKEGFHPTNALGIIISFVMLLGIVIAIMISNIFISGSDLQVRIYSAFTGIYNSIYAFLECFLIGSILCGTLAAKHEPEYNKDYLIILGCQIAPDGTLFPLLRSRVDRAIEFYNKQFEKTGKKAYFVPSGGQGNNEIISEAEAMKNYLLKKGIPKNQIIIEDKSINTNQNMSFSKKIIEEKTPNAKVAFSTTNYHVFRSGIISRENQFEIDGMGSKTKWYFWPNAYIREVIAVITYKWLSIIIVLIPIILFFIAIQFVG